MNKLIILIMTLFGVTPCANGQSGQADMKEKRIRKPWATISHRKSELTCIK